MSSVSTVDDLTRSGRGRRAVRVVEGALLLSGLLLAILMAIDAKPDDPGIVDVAVVGGPMLAIGAALVLSLTLVVLAGTRWVAVSLLRAVLVSVVALVAAPVAYLAAMFVLWLGLDAIHLLTVQILALIVGVLPVLAAIVVFRELARAPGEPRGWIRSIVAGILDGLPRFSIGS